MEWNMNFNNISIKCCDRLVQVKNDQALIDYLKKPGVGSLDIAKEMKRLYVNNTNCELKISEKSLAIEIIGHIFIENFAKTIEKFPVSKDLKKELKDLSASLKSHTVIIDCGESSVDTNRHIWDKLVPFSSIIFTIIPDV